MSWIRRNFLKILFIMTLFALPGADIECEDDEFEFDWPDWGRGGGWYYYPPVYYDPGPCCWYW